MLQFKSCPRCQGDVHADNDWFGEYLTCMQCGWSKDITPDPVSTLMKVREELAASVAIRKAS